MSNKPPLPLFTDLSSFSVATGFRGRSAIVTQLWWLVQDFLIRPSPQFMYGWRRFWWQLFGAKIGAHVLIRPSARVTFPWKVTIGDYSWIGDQAELYSLGEITVGTHTVISQHAYLCAGTHDYTKTDFPLVVQPIHIGNQVWVATGAFIAPGVTIGHGAIIGARSVVLNDVPPAIIVAGNPAQKIKDRPHGN